jgi:hypothetical protein
VQSDKPITMLRVILNGGRAVQLDASQFADHASFGWKLSDKQKPPLPPTSAMRDEKAGPDTAGGFTDLRDGIQTVTSDY